MEVEVIRSARRTKTVQASIIDGVLRIRMPARFTAEEERHWVAEMSARVKQRHAAGRVDLTERAHELAAAHGLPVPISVAWSHRQRLRWASCTPANRSIRISAAAASFPKWVIDYLLVHELAHIEIDNHSPAFWALVQRFPMSERARGYLVAKADGL